MLLNFPSHKPLSLLDILDLPENILGEPFFTYYLWHLLLFFVSKSFVACMELVRFGCRMRDWPIFDFSNLIQARDIVEKSKVGQISSIPHSTNKQTK
jgi:hypothetical protein